MSRRRAGLSPSLFPFLAVLVCTLGTLILLLALVATEARDTAKRDVEQEIAGASKSKPVVAPEVDAAKPEGPPMLTRASAKQLLDQETFRMEHFLTAREKQIQELERKREELTAVEEAKRKLREQLSRLNKEVETAMAAGKTTKVDQRTLVMMRSEIDKLETEVQQLRESSTGGKPRVVLVPHKGPNGTDRRPVYVECTSAGVTIWPEGTRISVPQLIGAANAERPSANALDAALRVVRSHAMKEYGDSIPPYPLIVVRPDGVDTYRYARAAMNDWDDQYGYELVPADVDLAFPSPDNRLRKSLDLAVHEAVQRGGVGSVAAGGGRGGRGAGAGAAAGGRSFEGDATLLPEGAASFEEGQFGLSGASGGSPSPGGAMSQSQNAAPSTPQDRKLPTLSARDLDQQARAGGFRQLRDGVPGRPGSFYNDTTPGSTQTSYGAAPTFNPQSQSASLNKFLAGENDLASGGGSTMTGDAGAEIHTPDGTGAGSMSTPSTGGGGKTDGKSGQAAEAVGTPTTDSQNASAPSRSTPTSGSPQQAMPPGSLDGPPPQLDPNQEMPTTPPPPTMTKMVQRGGKNWALPSSMAGINGTEVVRPISMICYPDRYELLEQGRVVGTYPFDANGPENATLGLATAVRDRVDTWGATLPGGRWQPRLEVLVAPHAERRFHDLRTLMNGSGVDVIQRVK